MKSDGDSYTTRLLVPQSMGSGLVENMHVHPLLLPAILLSFIAVPIGDYYTPLGITIWVVYLVPVMLSLGSWNPQLPLGLATLSTILIVTMLVTDRAETITREVALINRSFGILTIWILAIVGYNFIHNRLLVRGQQWLQAGRTGLNVVMSGDQRLEQLGENTLKFLAEYVHSPVAVMYVREEGRYRRIAAYALPSRNNVPESFLPGDGLLGQAVRDQRSFLIDDMSESTPATGPPATGPPATGPPATGPPATGAAAIETPATDLAAKDTGAGGENRMPGRPADFLPVGSSLGSFQTHCLLVSPMLADRGVIAVVEFGFFRRVDPIVQELVESVSEAVGVAVRSAHYRVHLQKLLEETQQQSEEMQVQSEELRVANEELEEQSRSLQESQSRLELQQVEMEQTNTQLEEQTQLLEAQRDDLTRARSEAESRSREVEQASRYKSDFLANMSHELRTPLNSSLILSKLLADNPQGNLTDDQVRSAETILSAGNDLLALINDILDLSKIEAGRLDIRPEEVWVSQVVEDLQATLQPMAENKGLVLLAGVADECPAMIDTDRLRLDQILKTCCRMPLSLPTWAKCRCACFLSNKTV